MRIDIKVADRRNHGRIYVLHHIWYSYSLHRTHVLLERMFQNTVQKKMAIRMVPRYGFLAIRIQGTQRCITGTLSLPIYRAGYQYFKSTNN